MTQPLWQRLTSLVGIDKRIDELKKQLQIDKNIIEIDKQNILKLTENISAKKATLKEYKKEIHRIELNAKEVDIKEQSKQKVLDVMHNQKEYDAISKELSILAIERIDLEDRLVAKWQDVEALEQTINKENLTVEKESEKLNSDIESKNENIKKLQKDIKELESEKQAKTSDIPTDWLNLYNNMKSKVENPVVPVLSESCSHCFYHILPQDLMRIKKGRLLKCKNCFRLLYNKEVDTATTPAGSY